MRLGENLGQVMLFKVLEQTLGLVVLVAKRETVGKRLRQQHRDKRAARRQSCRARHAPQGRLRGIWCRCRSGQTNQRYASAGKRGGQVGALVFNYRAVQFGHNRVEQHLLLAVGVDSDRTLLVLTRLVPDSKGREAWLVSYQVDLERIDHLDVRDAGVGNRHATKLAREVDNSRGSGLHLHHVIGQIMPSPGNCARAELATVEYDRGVVTEPLTR